MARGSGSQHDKIVVSNNRVASSAENNSEAFTAPQTGAKGKSIRNGGNVISKRAHSQVKQNSGMGSNSGKLGNMSGRLNSGRSSQKLRRGAPEQRDSKDGNVTLSSASQRKK